MARGMIVAVCLALLVCQDLAHGGGGSLYGSSSYPERSGQGYQPGGGMQHGVVEPLSTGGYHVYCPPTGRCMQNGHQGYQPGRGQQSGGHQGYQPGRGQQGGGQQSGRQQSGGHQGYQPGRGHQGGGHEGYQPGRGQQGGGNQGWGHQGGGDQDGVKQ